jgi:hypothetical protein
MLTGSVDASAIAGVDRVDVHAIGSNGYGSSFLSLSNAASFGIAAATGANRVLVLAYDDVSSPPASAGRTRLAAARSFDNQVAPGAVNGGNAIVLAAADATTAVPITYGSLPAGFTLDPTSANLVTSAGGAGYVLADPATADYPGLPAGATEGGDYYSIQAAAWSGNEVTTISKTSTTAVPVAFNFPAAWSYAGPSPASTPIFDLSYFGFSSANVVSYLGYWYWEPLNFDGRYFGSVHATSSYLNGATQITWPDLSGVSGFLSPADPGTDVQWVATVTQTNYSSEPASSANSTITSVSTNGSYKVP